MQKTIGVEFADGDPTPGLLQHGFDPMLWQFVPALVSKLKYEENDSFQAI